MGPVPNQGSNPLQQGDENRLADKPFHDLEQQVLLQNRLQGGRGGECGGVGAFEVEELDPVLLELPIEVSFRDPQDTGSLGPVTTYRVQDSLDVVPLHLDQGGKRKATFR